jgi:hypothetical protein
MFVNSLLSSISALSDRYALCRIPTGDYHPCEPPAFIYGLLMSFTVPTRKRDAAGGRRGEACRVRISAWRRDRGLQSNFCLIVAGPFPIAADHTCRGATKWTVQSFGVYLVSILIAYQRELWGLERNNRNARKPIFTGVPAHVAVLARVSESRGLRIPHSPPLKILGVG